MPLNLIDWYNYMVIIHVVNYGLIHLNQSDLSGMEINKILAIDSIKMHERNPPRDLVAGEIRFAVDVRM